MNSKIDEYIGRSTRWSDEMELLRSTLLEAGLAESIKWGKPCYSVDDANIAIMQEMKGFLALMFFKGALLDDPAGVLESQGPNSRSAMRICLRSVDEVEALSETIGEYVREAMAIEAAGLKVEPAPALVLGEELQARLDSDTELAAAFAALTPGRQREYQLHISSAKKAETRESRIDKCLPKILAGKGFRDR